MVINYWRGGPVNFGGGLCFFGHPFEVGHNFMGPRLGEGYNFWAPFIKTLSDVCAQMGFVLLTLAWQENLHRIVYSKLNCTVKKLTPRTIL